MLKMNGKLARAVFEKGYKKGFPLRNWRLEIRRGMRMPPNINPSTRSLLLCRDGISFRICDGELGGKYFAASGGAMKALRPHLAATYSWLRLVNKNGCVLTGDVGPSCSGADLMLDIV